MVGGGSALAKAKWKAQSDMFRNAMRAARGAPPVKGGGGKNGGKGGAGQQPQEDVYDDRMQCPHCGRKFAEQAGQRHVISCAKRAKEAAMRAGPPRGGRR